MLKTIQGDIYDYPRYYDLVYGSDWKAEFDFLTGCFSRYGDRKVWRVFEPACGTGRLLYRLAESGFAVSGLDLNEKAIAFCNRRLEKYGHEPSTFVGDMTDFRLPSKVDAAFNMINTFRHVLDHDAAAAHLECMAAAVRTGGLYLLGLHLTPTVGPPSEGEAWSARRGHLMVNTQMWLESLDLERRLETFGVAFDVYTPTNSYRLQDELVFRTYTAPQMHKFLHDSESWEVAAAFDFAYDLEHPIEVTDATEDVVYVLRRR